MTQALFYDPARTFDDNFDNGPFNMDPKDYRESSDPKESFLGQKIWTPFGIPAGPLPTSKHTNAAFRLGFDVVCYKTQRTVPFEANQFPHVLSLQVDGDLTLQKAAGEIVGSRSFPKDTKKLTITNSFGNPSRGPEFWVDDLKKAVKEAGKGQLLIMGVVGTIQEGFSPSDYYDDFAEAAKLAASTGVKAIELNLSCPNVASEGVLCYSPDAVYEICERSKAAVSNVPLVAKFGYFSEAQQPLLEDIVKRIDPFVDAISSINTIPAAIVDKNGKQALPGEGRLKSGCCGSGIRWAGLDMVKRLNSLRQKHNLKFEIVGVGGVMTPEDYQHYLKHGADCVQSATGAMWNQHLAQEIKTTLK